LFSFKNKIIVITGGSKGIGETIAKDFKKSEAKVIIIDIIEPKIEYDYFYKGDITQESVLENFSKIIIEKFNHIDYLINNACEGNGGIFNSGYEEFLYTQKLGVVAPFMLSKLFLNHFSKDASIINIASTRAFQSQKNTECYSAAKGGIVALTHSLAVSLQGKVRVNCISPGWIDTFNQNLSLEDNQQHLVKRVGKPEDISNAVQFLCSEKSSFITGENIIIDGGMSKQMIYHDDFGWNYKP